MRGGGVGHSVGVYPSTKINLLHEASIILLREAPRKDNDGS